MELSDALRSRHSIRSFSSEPVPKDVLKKVVGAAAMAPSAFNEQPWRFYVATGESRAKIGQIMAQNTSYLEDFMSVIGGELTDEKLRWYTELGGAPIVVACTMPKVDDEFSRLQKHLSIGAAVENLLLAATDAGLGSCMVTFGYWVRDLLGELLGVPDDRTIVAMVALGYPGEGEPAAPPRDMDIMEFVD
jgi:nitroreductase